MFKYSDLNYDEFYSSAHCKRENKEIESTLSFFCNSGDSVLDLGAGTGLISSMIGGHCKVTQVERDAGFKKQNPYSNFIVSDATEYVEKCSKRYDHVVSVFALNYMRKGTLTKAVSIADKTCFFVVYDQPYKSGSGSYYRGKKVEFLRKCGLRKMSIDREIQDLVKCGYCVTVWNLCGEPYYKAILVNRKE